MRIDANQSNKLENIIEKENLHIDDDEDCLSDVQNADEEDFEPDNEQLNKKRKLRQNNSNNRKLTSSRAFKSNSNLKVPKTSEFIKEDFVELDACCLAFLPSNDGCIPDLPYYDYDPLNKIVILPIKSRVVTYYLMTVEEADTCKSQKNQLIKCEYFCSATIAELPSARSNNRYLVFFDNGYTSYINPTHAFPIFDLFYLPIDRLHFDHSYFLRYYFEQYPERAMVRLQADQIVNTYFNNRWFDCKVLCVDSSLVKLEFKINMFENYFNNLKTINQKGNLTHSVWLYRGSYRLYPLFDQIMKKIKPLTSTTKSNDQLTQFEGYIKEKLIDPYFNPKGCLSIFASTLFPKLESKNRRQNRNKATNYAKEAKETREKERDEQKVTQGILKLLDLEAHMRNEIVQFTNHPCTLACIAKWEKRIDSVKSVNPLLMPVLHGWQRHICHQTKTVSTGAKKWINYSTPCGRMLRNTSEVDRYLYLTNSQLTLDMFSFDHYIHTDREYEANAKHLSIPDITYGNETVPISCVNCIDEQKPDEIEYSNKRVPLEGVPLNTNGENMEGCECLDNCRDRSKCACWKKTFEATLFANEQMNTNVGYRGRRLPEMVTTGIFECNSKCKCDCRCSNRVVQNGISIRLQLFKTPNKGWGLRCLDDLAKGAFICTYAGHLMTEDQSDIRGKELGDEYFAELDFVECLKKYGMNGEYESSQSDSDSLNNSLPQHEHKNKKANINNSLLNSSSYQRPKSSSFIPKKNQIESRADITCIFLDSDEDEQDRNDRAISYNNNDCSSDSNQAVTNQDTLTNNFNKSRVLNRQEKEKKMVTSIYSNRFFTNKNNKFFYMDYLKNPGVFIMDAKICGNIGRFFNHSCTPNLFVQNVFVDTYDLRFPWIAFFSLNSIKAGTELCWDYNYTIDSVQGRKLFCYCNSANCRGRLL